MKAHGLWGRIAAAVLVAASAPALAAAQSAAGTPPQATPIPPTAIPPDPANLLLLAPKDLKWSGAGTGQLTAPLFGDPNKPGPYGILVKWLPGHMSHPHSHSTDRWAYVVEGTWWVSTSDHYDPKTTYPLTKGTLATDLADKVHWDGAKDEEVTILLFGIGPVTTKSAAGK